jgi:hypothetical protein
MSNPALWVNGAAAVFWMLSAIAWWRASRPFEDSIKTAAEGLVLASRRSRDAASVAVAAALLQALSVAGPAVGLWE